MDLVEKSNKSKWKPRKMPALQIARAARILARLADGRFRELGISMSQFPVLVALRNGGQPHPKAAGISGGVEQPSMAQLLARMQRDGLIRREIDPTDRRSSRVSLRPETLDNIGPARIVLAQGNADALAGFDDGDTATLLALLERVIANLSAGDLCGEPY